MGLIVNGRMRFLGKFEGVFPQLSPPTPSFTANPTTGLVPLTVQFTNTTTTASYVTYQWDFTGDGVVDSTDVNPTYTYVNTGTYTVSLTSLSTGGTATTTVENYIIAFTIPPATFSAPVSDFFPFKMAVYDDYTYVGPTVNNFPFVIAGDRSSETYVGTENTFPFVMTNYVHS